MTRGPAVAAAALWLLIVTAGVATAQLPSPANSILPPVIPVVGLDGNFIPDPLGEFDVVVYDAVGIPVNGSEVSLDFSACTDLRLCQYPGPGGIVVYCGPRWVVGYTRPTGAVPFRVVGGGTGVAGLPGSGPDCARVWADGILLGTVPVAMYDLDGGGGLGPSDLSMWLQDHFGAMNPMRSDYDASGDVGPADLSLWLGVHFGGGSPNSCPSGLWCPPGR